jgi:HEAT repeat protein
MKTKRLLGYLALLLVLAVAVVVCVRPWRLVVWGYLRNERFQDGRPLRYWIAILEDKDSAPAERQRAIHALGEAGPDAELAIPALLASLNASTLDPNDREAVAAALKKIGPAAARALIRHDRGSRYVLRFDPQLLVPLLVEALTDENETTRQDAIRLLGELGATAKPAVPALVEAWKYPSVGWITRREIARTLAQVGPEAVKTALPALIETLQGSGPWDDQVCIAIAQALKVLGPDSAPAVSALCKAIAGLQQGRVEAVTNMAETLGAIGPGAQRAVPILLELANDKDQRARLAVARALWHIDPHIYRRQERALNEVCNDPDFALWLIGTTLGGKQQPFERTWQPEEQAVLPGILAELKAKDDLFARTRAVMALRLIGKDAVKASLPQLGEALQTSGWGTSAEILALLQQLGPEAGPALPNLITFLRRPYDGNSGENECLEKVFGIMRKLGPAAQDATPVLAEWARKQNTSPFVRQAAAAALIKVNPEGARKAGIQ